MFQWGYQASSDDATVNLPQTYEKNVAIFCQRLNIVYENTPTITSYGLTQFSYQIRGYNATFNGAPIFWFAIGT